MTGFCGSRSLGLESAEAAVSGRGAVAWFVQVCCSEPAVVARTCGGVPVTAQFPLELAIGRARDGTGVRDLKSLAGWWGGVPLGISFKTFVPMLSRPICHLLPRPALSGMIQPSLGQGDTFCTILLLGRSLGVWSSVSAACVCGLPISLLEPQLSISKVDTPAGSSRALGKAACFVIGVCLPDGPSLTVCPLLLGPSTIMIHDVCPAFLAPAKAAVSVLDIQEP
nr:uncharacterized protein LOC111773132 isoform X3 [Equus caballus]